MRRVAFRHALIAQTLYEGLAAARRRDLHRRAALALESDPDIEDAWRAPALGEHWARASVAPNFEQSIYWARRAGAQAMAQFAPQKAQRWYGQALELHPRQTAPSEYERCSSCSNWVALARSCAWPTAKNGASMIEAALGDLESARERVGATVHRADLLPAPVWAARARVELGRCLLGLGDVGEGEAVLTQARRDAEQLGCGGLVSDADELVATRSALR